MKICEYRFDSTINSNLLPRFNSNYNYTVSEQAENNNIIKRTIESDTYPTSVTFSGEQALIELLHLDATELVQLVQSFYNCTNLTYLSLSNTGKVTDINHMCYNCPNLTEVRFVNCDLSKVANIVNIFNGGATNSVEKLDLTGAKLNNTSKGIIGALRNASTLIVDKINTDNVTSMNSMFNGCVGLTEIDLSDANMTNVTDLASMFNNCPNLKKVVLKNKTLDSVTNMSNMLRGCPKLTEVDFSGFRVPNVTNLSYMFFDSPNLKRVDLSDLGATKVNDLSYMFGSNSGSNITHINLSGVKTVSTVNISHTFYYCLSLEWIDLSNLDISGSTSTTNFFSSGLTVLKEIGACYCSSATINKLITFNWNCNYNLYYTNAKLSELTPRDNCTFVYYDEYKTNVLYLPPSLTLRSNGDTYDEYNPFTSQFTQRIGEDGSVLDRPVTTTVKSIVAYNDTVKYGYALPDKTTDLYHPEIESYEQVIDSATLDGSENWTKVNQTTFTIPFTNAKSETSTEVFTMKDDVESITIINDTLSLIFKETSYVVTNNIAVNALKIWLQTNNIEFKYELKDHVFTNMALEEFDFDNAHFVKPQAYKGGAMTQSNKDDLIFAPITYQTKSNNRYELPLLDSNSEYTLHYEGSVKEVDLGGSTNSSVESNGLVQSGSSDKVVLFDDEVTNVMLIKGDVREQTIPYFQGLLSTQAPVLKSVNKKLVDITNITITENKVLNFNGNDVPYADYIVLENIPISPNNLLAFNVDGTHYQRVSFYDESMNFIVTKDVFNKNAITPPSNARFMRVGLKKSNLSSFFIELNVEKINDEIYKTSILSTPKDIELRSIGSLCDTLDCKTGELTKHTIVMDDLGNYDMPSYTTHDGTNNPTTPVLKISFQLPVPLVDTAYNSTSNFPLICDKFKVRGDANGYSVDRGTYVSTRNGQLFLHLIKEEVGLPKDVWINKSHVQNYFKDNPIKVICKTQQPVIETVDLDIEYKEGDKKYIVRTHDDVTHVNVSSEGLSPITEIGYITNEDNVKTVTLEDGTVTLENAKPHSVIQRAFMTGQTLVNLVSQYENSNGVLKATINGTFETNKKYIIRIYNNPFNVKSRQIVVKDATYQYTYFAENRVFINDMNRNYNQVYVELTKSDDTVPTVDEIAQIKVLVLEYQEGMENWDIPYFEGMQSVKLPVLKTVSGFNLLNPNAEPIAYQGNDVLHPDYFKAKFGDSFSVTKKTSGELWCSLFCYDSDKNLIKAYYQNNHPVPRTITLNDDSLRDVAYVRFECAKWTPFKDIMLNYGEQMPFAEYSGEYKSNILTVNEPVELRGIGDVKDELDLITGELTQNIAEAVLSTFESYGASTSNGIYYMAKTKVANDISPRHTLIIGANKFISKIYSEEGGNFEIRVSSKEDGTYPTRAELSEYLSQNPLTLCYIPTTSTVKTVDLTLTQQNVPSEKMTYFKDYYGQLVSDGTLPKFTYRLESTNTYNVSQLKPNTLYTMYSEGEATVATLGGKASILLNNPQTLTSGTQNKSLTFDSPTSKVVLIEKDVTNQVVPYFTGTLDTVNPIIKTTSGNKSNTVSTNVCLRSVGDVCDTYDLNTGTLVKRVGEDHRVLDHPETSNIPVNTPVAYHGATVEMSSNELSLLPRFEYSCKSPNYYPLPVESNEVYTLKFDKTSNGTLTMGGVTANTTGNQTITTKNSDVQGVLFSEDLGIGNLMVMKTDVRNVPTPYFRGIQSVVNPTITVSNGDTQSNSVSLTLTMRSLPNGVKDELNLVTGEYIQRLDQRNFAEGDVNGRDMITDGTTTIYPLTVPRRSTLELNWSDGVLTAYDGTTNVTTEAELLKPHLFFQLATSTLEEIISQLKDENASLLETVATLEEDNLSTMVAVTEVFETVLVMMPMTLSVNNDTKGGGSYMVEVYVTLILKGKKTLEQVPAVIRPQVEQMLKDVDAL